MNAYQRADSSNTCVSGVVSFHVRHPQFKLDLQTIWNKQGSEWGFSRRFRGRAYQSKVTSHALRYNIRFLRSESQNWPLINNYEKTSWFCFLDNPQCCAINSWCFFDFRGKIHLESQQIVDWCLQDCHSILKK